MALNSSKNIDHGNYIPSPIVHGVKVADGEHIRKVFVLGSADVAVGTALRAGESVAKAATPVIEPAEVAGVEIQQAFQPVTSMVTESAEVTVGPAISPDAKSATEPVEVTGLSSIPANIEVGADATLDLTVIVLPGVSVRIPLTIDLTGAHSEVRLSGIYLCSGHDKVTFDITMHHRTGDCRSQQTFNGLASGEAKCGFFGKIVIAPDAQRTEAYQENHNILLSDSAKVNTKPRLEIYADDVKCSHGATVGKLNEDEQFYMRSRGIPEDEAKILQMISFVAPVLETIPEEATDGELSRSAVTGLVENAIRSFA